MATADVIQDQDEQEQEHLGGGRFNRLLGVVFVAESMGDGEPDGGLSRIGTVRGAGSANDGAGIESAAND